MRHFYEWAHESHPMFVPSFTIYTLMELRRHPALFDMFIEQFAPFPCVMVKGYAHLLEEEVAAYPDPTRVDPCGIAFMPLGGEGNKLSNLPQLLDSPDLVEQERRWNEAGPEIVEGMVSLVSNYPPRGDTYTRDEVRFFVWLASLSQLAYHAPEFAKAMDGAGQEIDTNAFPTLKAMTYTVFHKFYTDPNRKPSPSDAFDVLISAALPYVEAIITEAHLSEAIRKTKRRDDFLIDLRTFTLRDFRGGSGPI